MSKSFIIEEMALPGECDLFYFEMIPTYIDFPDGSVVKNLPAKLETQVWFLVQEDPL